MAENSVIYTLVIASCILTFLSSVLILKANRDIKKVLKTLYKNK